MRPQATCVCGLKPLVYEALSYLKKNCSGTGTLTSTLLVPYALCLIPYALFLMPYALLRYRDTNADVSGAFSETLEVDGSQALVYQPLSY